MGLSHPAYLYSTPGASRDDRERGDGLYIFFR